MKVQFRDDVAGYRCERCRRPAVSATLASGQVGSSCRDRTAEVANATLRHAVEAARRRIGAPAA